MDEFIGQLFNFDDYITWLETTLYPQGSLPDYYVDLACSTYFTKDKQSREISRELYDPIDIYVDDWLKAPGKNHLSILGDFGSGKTWFCRYYAYKQLQRYKANPARERLPVLVNLRDYTKRMDIELMLTTWLDERGVKMTGGYRAFEELNRSGKLLLIFDGFDEMAQKADYNTILSNVRELTKAIMPGSKVILTCRTPYFRYAQEAERILGGGGMLQNDFSPPKFEVVYLEEFNDEKIQKALLKRLNGNKSKAKAYWGRIRHTFGLVELARKPVMLEMITDALPTLKLSEPVDPAKLYLVSINKWLDKNISEGRLSLQKEDMLTFMSELAWEMLTTNQLKIHYKDLPRRIQQYFISKIKGSHKPPETIEYAVRTQSFLVRDAEGNFEFTHKSFMEFLVAKKLVGELQEGKTESFKMLQFPKEVLEFVACLLAYSPPEVFEKVCMLALEGDEIARWNSSYILTRCNEQKICEFLRLHQERIWSNAWIMWTLGELKSVAVDETMREFLEKRTWDSSDSEAWWNAAFALWKLGCLPDPVHRLKEALTEPWTVNEALTHLRDKRAPISVLKELDRCKIDKSDLVRKIEAVVQQMADFWGTYNAVWLLGELREPSSIDTLIKATESEWPSVRNAASEALGKIGCPIGPRGINAIVHLLHDSYYRTRFHAAQVLEKVGPPEIVEELQKVVQYEWHPDVREQMQKTIKKLQTTSLS